MPSTGIAVYTVTHVQSIRSEKKLSTDVKKDAITKYMYLHVFNEADTKGRSQHNHVYRDV